MKPSSLQLPISWPRLLLLGTSLLLVHQGPAHAQMSPHPPVGHGSLTGNGRAADSSEPSGLVARGTVLVRVVDAQGQPAPGADVELVTKFNSIELGDSERSKHLTVGPTGEVTFPGLDGSIRYNYVVKVKSSGALYQTAPFRLGKTGHQVVSHVYPTTSDIRQAFVGFRGLTFIQLREDVFHVSVMYRVLNMSSYTFLPRDLDIRLPKKAHAIDVETKTGDAGFERHGDLVRLVGTYPPGQKDLQFSFQIKNDNQADWLLEMGVPPHLAEQRVLVEDIPGVDLKVAGFGPAESTAGPDGKKVLFAQRVMQPGQTEMKLLRVELSGLPVVGPGRYIAASLASVIGLFGIGAALGRRKINRKSAEAEREEARRVLLEEMKLLELAHSQEQVGPRTYEQTRREILLALARMEVVPSEALNP